ncbi:hypothetical protein FRACYDRAFT_252518 [Fragilariopsis cylindrus CCMP1102]|uniref:DUF2470 domain-containing protein n=1 Tax=Fragilariopsis cylindrus CCMP1102 TaxID=635003 RepID=A0A1E7ELT9_9STRA|nr:hypothetical protein FRACYDRAFT_252518 [Fragilariopsis cylindrus CCMP1102]|eukprot:OEU06888.1 hypothetical protein FRACYDRAFT_252518 [Fragilariopsis cylindrus CCMP1102]
MNRIQYSEQDIRKNKQSLERFSKTTMEEHTDVDNRVKLEQDIRKNAPRVMKHMNEDHEDSLIAYVLAFATGVEGHIENNINSHKEAAQLQQVLDGERTILSAKLTDIDSIGFLLEISTVEVGVSEKNKNDHHDRNDPSSSLCTSKVSNVRVPYDRPIEKARDLHQIAIRMHRSAYDKLGIWYKTKNGYYQQVATMVTVLSYKSLKKNKKIVVMVVGVTAAVAAVGYFYLGLGTNTKKGSDNNNSSNNNLTRSATTKEMLKSRMTYWMPRE